MSQHINQETRPLCEEALLEPFVREEAINFRGGPDVSVTLEYSRCPECGAELTTPAQTKANQKRIADVRRKKEGLLTGDQIKSLREHYEVRELVRQASDKPGSVTCPRNPWEKSHSVTFQTHQQLASALRVTRHIRV